MTDQIPLVDVKAQYAPLIPELEERFSAVLESGRFIFGPEVEAFEREAAAYLGVPHAIGVANGTDALVLALDALGIGRGDEVICPSFTFYATAEAIARVGATPVFADIDPVTLNLDGEDVATRITERTKAIMPVHLFGRPAELDGLVALGLPLIEDAAQAFGADGVAQTGICSTFSFFPTKNLFALGDGGLVTCLDDEVAERVRMLHFHGSRDKRTFELVGVNSRLDAIQAAMLRVFLPRLAGWNAGRREAAARYAELGLGELVELPGGRAGARVPHVRRPLVAPEGDRRGACGGGHRLRVVLREAYPSATGVGVPRRAGRIAPGDGACCCGEPRPSDVGRHRAGAAGARGRRGSLDRRRPGIAMHSPVNRHRLWQVAVDAVLIAAAWILSWYVRFDADWPRYYDRYLEWDVVALVVGVMLPVFIAFGFYNRWWRYVSTQDMWGVLRGVAVALVAAFLVFAVLDFHPAKVPRGIWVIDLLLLLAFVMGVRLLARSLIERPSPRSLVARGREVLIVGAGDAAQLILREMLRNPSLGYTPIGLVDDDPRKKNLRLHGIRVLGTTAELPALLRERRPDELLIAIPSASGDVRERIVAVARSAGIPVKTLPALYELIAGDFNLAGQIRPVEVEDLLGREPVEADLQSIAGYLTDEVVLVTGAGGSIGSELCRQIARMGPTRLVLVDNGEPGLFEIERELVDEREFLATAAVLADAGNATKMRQVFEKYRPAVVFHAAAYKHVPLMEANPLEAVRNNTLVTRTVADIAVEFGAKRFVLVSTDKAVNAKTVMGQSKAICEWIVESWGHREDTTTRFCGVRFGNVLGSSGSVIPIFRKQIARGGPVTVTHAEMTRFFMTIPEAVQLIIQAGSIGGRGQVYVLDMGEPVKITDLADTMIRLSGKEPGVDVAVEFVGARPGEKLHEELWSETEHVSPSSHEAIMLVTRAPIDQSWLEDELDELAGLVESGETLELIGRLTTICAAPHRVGAPDGDGAGIAEAPSASEA